MTARNCKNRFAVLMLLLLCIDVAHADSPDEILGKELQEFFASRQMVGFSGVVLAAHGETVLLRGAYGTSSCSGKALDPEQVFLIGSITKVFTKAAIYKLAAQGKLTLDDPIARYLPNVPEDKQAITVRMLAGHRSGLDDTVDALGRPVPYSPDWDYLPVSREEIIERAMNSTLLYEPGSDQQYSNLGYSLLAAIIEHVSGVSYEVYLRTGIFEPLGMKHTGYVLPDWSGTRITNGCYNGEDWIMPLTAGRWMKDGPSWNLRGNGGMMGTMDDLKRWVDALRRAEFLPAETMSEFLSDVVGRSRTFEESATAAAGGNGIYNSFYLWLVDSDLVLIMISNNGDHQVESYLDQVFPMIARSKIGND